MNFFKMRHLDWITLASGTVFLMPVSVLAQADPYIALAVLLNREDDCSPVTNGTQVKCGVNLDVQSNNNQGSIALELEGGMLLASGASGTDQTLLGQPRGYAGQNQGGGMVLTGPQSPAIIRSPGKVLLGGGAQWLPAPLSGPDGVAFLDPTFGLSQPRPSPPSSLRWGPTGPIARAHSAVIAGGPDETAPTPLPPGVYYSTEFKSNGAEVANGAPVRLGQGHFRFEPASESFGEYVFIGGLAAEGGAVHVQVSPGIYFLAGARELNNKPGSLLRLNNGSTFSDDGPLEGPALDGGELFVFSDARLPGIAELAQFTDAQTGHDLTNLVLGSATFAPLRQGIAGILGPNNGQMISVNLHALTNHAPGDLLAYSRFVFWQDRNNSIVDYTDEDGSPGGIYCGSTAPGCSNTGEPRLDQAGSFLDPEPPAGQLNSSFPGGASTEMILQPSPNVHLFGVSYQPRGAFLSVVGDSTMGRLLLGIVSGAIRIQQNSSLHLGVIMH